ncbi:MAG: M20/M25/M40 family metallo-hydrolase, partial [Pseudomonadales bacterium]
MNKSDTLAIARSLIQEESISPKDGACQRIIADYLTGIGFAVEHLPFGAVSNLWAIRPGAEAGPLFAFAGHTDVVPTGPRDEWRHPPFDAHVEGDLLHGRGAADMKGSVAAMLTAANSFIEAHPDYKGSIAFLITSDEEDQAIDGTVKVMETLTERGTAIDYCLVGEPSSSAKLADAIRVGRRGSLDGRLSVRG